MTTETNDDGVGNYDGAFLGGKVWRSDPSHGIIKSTWVILAFWSLLAVWYAEALLARLPCGVTLFQSQLHSGDSGRYEYFDYDTCVRQQRKQLDAYDSSVIEEYNDTKIENYVNYYHHHNLWLRLFERTIGLSPDITVQIVVVATILYLSALVLFLETNLVTKGINASKSCCYDDMFCEPNRRRHPTTSNRANQNSSGDAVIQRPGNTISNVTYFVASVLIFSSLCLEGQHGNELSISSSTTLWYSDALFGCMMFALSVSSTLWHSWNISIVHYVDLWSMDSTIIYLILRNLSVSVFYHAAIKPGGDQNGNGVSNGGLNSGSVEWLIMTAVEKSSLILEWQVLRRPATLLNTNTKDIALAMVYSLIIARLGYYYFFHLCWKHRYLHGSCLFTVRKRLSSTEQKSNVWTKGHFPIGMGEVCVFAAMPAFFVGIPLALQLLLLDHTYGSIRAGMIAHRTLVFGWSYRLLEKWALDGSFCGIWGNQAKGGEPSFPESAKGVHENNIVPMSSPWGTLLNALLSPTAILHWTTGITLLAGYVYARSVEQECLVSLL
ncbi:unnamed protein product [Pseudo-nitzschia multistriata]|uniref:Uncharacterized protein n=1 Tax=Pseudo-nitzschia multistriata TaxID=183589 RepID=A0A448YVJ4_9STRA|nr:unnamed protein product [Pseudo-nitzschia multistriata]